MSTTADRDSESIKPASTQQTNRHFKKMGWALGSGTLIQGLNSSIIAVAMVSLSTHFDDPKTLPWVVSGMYIASAVASPAAGRLVDIFGARKLFITGLVIVLGAALCGPFVPSLGWLVIVRIVMGIGASVHFPSAMVMLRRRAEETNASPKTAIGILTLCGQTVSALGPSIGGLTVVLFGWQGIFWINVPLVAASYLWLRLTVPASIDRSDTQEEESRKTWAAARALFISLDVPGLVTFVAALTVLMLGLFDIMEIGSGNLLPLAWMGGALILFACLIIHELRATSPFLDVRLLMAHSEIVKTCGRTVVTFLAFYSVYYGLPQWFETSMGLSPAMSGLMMIAVFGTSVLSTSGITLWGKRVPSRLLLVIGGLLFTGAGAFMAVALDIQAPVWVILIACSLLGLPNGFNNIGNQSLISSASPPQAVGVASGLYRTSQYVGAALSTVLVSTVLAAGHINGGISALGYTIAAIGFLLAALSAIRILRTGARSW